MFKTYKEVMNISGEPVSIAIDKWWYAAWLFSTESNPRPNWNGFMQDISQGDHPGKSESVMLPIIDLDSKDDNCIYSTLLFVIEQS